MSAPLLLLHSEADQVVPFSHAQLLYGAAPAGSRLEVVEGAHIAALNSAAVRDLVIEFIATACTANGGTPSGA